MEGLDATVNRRLKIITVTLVLLVLVLGAGFSILYWNLNSQYETLSRNYSSLEAELRQLRNYYEALSPSSGELNVSVSRIYELVEPSVVQIRVRVATTAGEAVGGGSGFVYDTEGHIVTNAHVVTEATDIVVTFYNGTEQEATLVGVDVYSDLAVLKVEAPQEMLRPVLLGDSARLEIGEPIIAIGSPFGLGGTVTLGIVSQKDRMMPAAGNYLIPGIIQVDAAINPGNSGGPLVNMRGEVVGVNSAVISRTGEFTGIGFAISVNLVKRAVPDLIEEGAYKHPWLGISGRDLTIGTSKELGLEETTGFLITDVVPGSPADQAGLKGGSEAKVVEGVELKVGGDVIIEVDGRRVRGIDDIIVYIEYNKSVGDKVDFKILRNHETLLIQVGLGERPPPS